MIARFMQLYESGQRFVVFDVETVGSFATPTIVEIGAVEAGRAYKDNYHSFSKILKFCPASWEPYEPALRVHKIPTQQIENGEDRYLVLRDFLLFIKDATLISHTSFDVKALSHNLQGFQDLQAMVAEPLMNNFIDSCALAKQIYPELNSFALGSLADFFKIHNPQAHRALADALTTKRIIAKLLQHHYAGKVAGKR